MTDTFTAEAWQREQQGNAQKRFHDEIRTWAGFRVFMKSDAQISGWSPTPRDIRAKRDELERMWGQEPEGER